MCLKAPTPPVNNIHSKVEVTGSNAPSKVKGKSISIEVSEESVLIFWNVSHVPPGQVNEDRQSNQNQRSNTNRCEGAYTKDKGPNDVEDVGDSEENVSFKAPNIFYEIVNVGD